MTVVHLCNGKVVQNFGYIKEVLSGYGEFKVKEVSSVLYTLYINLSAVILLAYDFGFAR